MFKNIYLGSAGTRLLGSVESTNSKSRVEMESIVIMRRKI